MKTSTRTNSVTHQATLALLLVTVLTVPLLFSRNVDAWRGVKPIVFELLVLALVGLSLVQATLPRGGQQIGDFLRRGPNLPVLLLVLYGAVSWYRSPFPAFSGAEWVRLACGAGLYFVVGTVLHRRVQIRTIVDVLTAVAILTSLAGILAYGQTDKSTVSSSFGNEQLFSGFLLVLAPLLLVLSFSELEPMRKIVVQLAFVLTVTSLLLAQTRSSWLAAVVALVVLALLGLRHGAPGSFARNRSRMIAPLLTVLSALSLLLMVSRTAPLIAARGKTLTAASHDADFRWRIVMWQGACKLISARPLFGWGIGTFPLEQSRTVPGAVPRDVVQRTGPTLTEEAHNEYLQLAAEMGITGLGLHLWILGAFFAYGVRAARRREDGYRRLVLMGCLASLAGQAVDALSNPAWRFADVGFLFWLIMGLGMASARSTRSSEAGAEVEAPARPNRRLARLGWQVVALAFTVFAMGGAWAAQYPDDGAPAPPGQAAAAAGHSLLGLASVGQALGVLLVAATWFGAWKTVYNAQHHRGFRGFSPSPSPVPDYR